MLYRVIKAGMRQAAREGGFRRFNVGDRMTCSEDGARPWVASGFLELVTPAPHTAPAPEVGQAEPAAAGAAEVQDA